MGHENQPAGRLCDVIEIAGVGGTLLRLAVDRANGDVAPTSVARRQLDPGLFGLLSDDPEHCLGAPPSLAVEYGLTQSKKLCGKYSEETAKIR
jgi:hypothetical protein